MSAKDEHRVMGRKAREFAQDRYALQKVALRHIALYERVLSSAHAVGTSLSSSRG
jgi:hypothetical protein